MQRFAFLCGAAILVGCAKTENQAGTSAAPPPPAINLAQVAGKWTVRAMPEQGDSTLVTYQMVATANTSGWTLTLPGRPIMPMRVSVAGDRFIAEAGPYESVLRRGVQVSTRSSGRLQGGKLVGTFVAHYSVQTADSVLRGRFEGTRAP